MSDQGLPSVSGIAIPVLSGIHNWTREHFVNRPDIEFLRDSVTGMEIYPFSNAYQIGHGKTVTILWPNSGTITSGVNLFLSGGAQINLSGITISGISLSGVI